MQMRKKVQNRPPCPGLSLGAGYEPSQDIELGYVGFASSCLLFLVDVSCPLTLLPLTNSRTWLCLVTTNGLRGIFVLYRTWSPPFVGDVRTRIRAWSLTAAEIRALSGHLVDHLYTALAVAWTGCVIHMG